MITVKDRSNRQQDQMLRVIDASVSIDVASIFRAAANRDRLPVWRFD
jgi:hypothetical protein